MTYREHLQTIYDKHGHLDPDLVVAEAAPADHPLHQYIYGHTPEEADMHFRRAKAHRLIQRCRIVYRENADTPERSIRAFTAVRTKHGNVFEPTHTVVRDPVLREITLRDMEREWRQLHARWSHFREFAEMVLHDLSAEAA